MAKGYVYILTNPCFNAYFKSKIVKIGQAIDVKKRVATLNTSVPVRFDVFATLYTSKYKIVEKKIHQRLKGVSAIKELQGERRVTAENGEFYLITPKKALRVLIDESELIDESDKSFELYGHGKTRKSRSEEEDADSEEIPKPKQSNFSFAEIGIKPGEKLQFTETPLMVVVANSKNKITYDGRPYTLSGFVKAFHPHPSKSGAYQGPRFFTYNGKILADLRSAAPAADASVAHDKCRMKVRPSSDTCTAQSFENVTQLAKYIARQGGNEGAAGGVGQILTARRRCLKMGKWRKPLEDIGVKFNAQDFVSDWQCAKKEFWFIEVFSGEPACRSVINSDPCGSRYRSAECA